MASFSCLYCQLWAYFTPCSNVSIVNFEKVNAGRVTVPSFKLTGSLVPHILKNYHLYFEILVNISWPVSNRTFFTFTMTKFSGSLFSYIPFFLLKRTKLNFAKDEIYCRNCKTFRAFRLWTKVVKNLFKDITTYDRCYGFRFPQKNTIFQRIGFLFHTKEHQMIAKLSKNNQMVRGN